LPEEIFPAFFAGRSFFVQPCFGFLKPNFPLANSAGRKISEHTFSNSLMESSGKLLFKPTFLT
jgi:hypothetical protein